MNSNRLNVDEDERLNGIKFGKYELFEFVSKSQLIVRSY